MIKIYYFDGEVKEGDLKNLNELRKYPLWLDIIKITPEEKKKIEEEFRLHPLTAEDLVNQNTRIKVEEFKDYLFSVFYGLKYKKGIETFEMDFVVGENWIISNHKEEISTFEDLKNDKDKLKDKFERGIDFIFHGLLDKEIDSIFPALEYIDDKIENLEEEISDRPRQKTLNEIIRLKRRIVGLKKLVLPQREKTGFLAKNDYKHLSKKSIPYFRDVYDHMVKVSDSVDNYREAIGGTYDSYMAAISNRMNEVMKILSIIATITLPLTVMSGIYGTNFDILPGQHFKYGFYLMIGIMALLVGIIIALFSKKKWI